MLRLMQSLLILSFLLGTAEARQIFIDDGDYLLSIHTLSEKYCRHIDHYRKFCEAKSLSYIDDNVSDLPDFLEGLRNHIEPAIRSYRQKDLKKEVWNTTRKSDGEISGEWYDKTRIGLFAKTPATYTLSFESNGFSGGAHGYDTVSYTNIDISTQKSLPLKELFLPGTEEKLAQIALAYYKLARNMKPYQPLTYDAWFEDRFKLPENYAITSYGLYFLYNQYEIKPYAEGRTDFFLPYAAIRSIIDPKGPLAFALKVPKEKMEAVFENDQMRLSFKAQKKGDWITIWAHLTPKYYALHAWLTISLPQIRSKKYLLSTGYNGFERLIPYDTKNKVYNRYEKKAVPAKYMILEADKVTPEYDKTYTMWFRIKEPPKLKTLIIDIRATLKRERNSFTLPEEYEGVTGVQGYKNYRMFLPLK